MGTVKTAKRTQKRKVFSMPAMTTDFISKLTDARQIPALHLIPLNAAIRGQKLVFETYGPYDTLMFLDGDKAKEKVGEIASIERPNFWKQASGGLLDLLGFNKEEFDFSKGHYEGTASHILQQLDVKVRWAVKVSFGIFECPSQEILNRAISIRDKETVELFAAFENLDLGYINLEFEKSNAPLWLRNIRESDGVPVVDISGKQYDAEGNYVPTTIVDFAYEHMRSEIAHSDYDGYELFYLKIELTVLGAI